MQMVFSFLCSLPFPFLCCQSYFCLRNSSVLFFATDAHLQSAKWRKVAAGKQVFFPTLRHWQATNIRLPLCSEVFGLLFLTYNQWNQMFMTISSFFTNHQCSFLFNQCNWIFSFSTHDEIGMHGIYSFHHNISITNLAMPRNAYIQSTHIHMQGTQI